MSMESHVFFAGTVPTVEELQKTFEALKFPVSISDEVDSLEDQSGFMPMLLRGEESGVEFNLWEDGSMLEDFAEFGIDPTFVRNASTRWGGDMQELRCGLCVTAALASARKGVVFDEAEGRLLTAEEAIAVARNNLQ